MQITEQIIQRIARQVFNQMFPSSLRQSGAIISGSGGSVQYAVEAGHAASADLASYATSAGSANAVAWANVSGKPDTATRWPAWSEVTEKPTSFTPPLAADGTRGGIQIGFTTSAENRNYAVQLSNEKAYVNVPWTDHYAWSDITDKPATATRWPTWSEVTSKPANKTAWGQTYLDGDSAFQNISGNMTNVGDISFAATGKNIGSIAYFDTTNYRLGVGVPSPSYRLQVDGQIYTNNSLIVVHNQAAVHVGSSTSNRISLHWAAQDNNKRGLYDYTSAWVIGTDGTNTFLSKGNVGIGTESPSYKLHVDGTIYATGSITERSDLNDKNVETYAWAPALSAIADAPIAIYTMKDDPEQRRRVGSIAQYWDNVMPEAVCHAANGKLSMSYGEIGLVGLIALAREVRNLKAQIEMLKRR